MTLFEQSFEEWAKKTKGSRAEWSQICRAEWVRIQASLIDAGHWHGGATCREAHGAEAL